MKAIQSWHFILLAISVLSGGNLVKAQHNPTPLAAQLAQSHEQVLTTTEQYIASLETLLAIEEANVKGAAETHAKRQQLFAEGIISKRELAASEHTLAAAQAQLAAVRKQLAEADELTAEVAAAQEVAKAPLAKVPASAAQTSRTAATMIRYNGATSWSLADLAEVQSFFLDTFGHPLPTSAIGQTATHNKLGFNHRHAVDVAVHPDSAQGQALMNYLRSQGIPFIAFRAAVPGSATGAHIHIGKPSHRLSSA